MSAAKTKGEAAGATPRPGSWVAIIKSVNSYLAFVVLVLLVVNAVLGAVVLRGQGPNQTLALYAFIALVVLLVAVVTAMAYIRPSAVNGDALQQLQAFSRKASGSWWELITSDGTMVVSHLRISADPATATLRIQGQAYDAKGARTAEWATKASCIDLTNKTVFYYWKGWKHASPHDSFEGMGEIGFDDAMDTATGYYSDTNFGDLKSTTIRRFLMRRVTAKEEQSLKSGPQALSALIQALALEYALA
ncbi:MAG TPA: hypothetical protein VGM25_09075 [Caulobacteraceae bacterium]|jgi:hypothetical protein